MECEGEGGLWFNDLDKRKFIKALIRNQRVDLVCLQETKVQEMSFVLVHLLGDDKFLGWKVLNFNGQLEVS